MQVPGDNPILPETAPLLTIVMPVFNVENHISQALAHIAEQTFGNYELLIIDGLSSDSTKSIVINKQAADKRIRLVSEKDKGIYDAMNKGAALAKGEWIYFMGSDDVFFGKLVLEHVASTLTKDTDIVYGDVLWVPGGDLEKGLCIPKDLINRNINHQRIFYRANLFKQYGGYNLQYPVASDHELNIRFFCNKLIKKSYLPLTIARYHSGGFSGGKLDKVFWDNWKKIFKSNLAGQVPIKEMYHKLGWYSRYLIEQHQYPKAMLLFADVFVHTFSPGILKLTVKQFFQSLRTNAS